VNGDGPDHIFDIEITGNKKISALKELIKDKKKPIFDHVPADDLKIWKVSALIDTHLGHSR
jgi:hypothetical protein